MHGWTPPQLVTVGTEKSGKSTLLERLCMMPMFPHAEDICTRMQIQVRLRRKVSPSNIVTLPRLEVLNLKTQKTELTRTIAMQGALFDVRAIMEDIIRRQNQGLKGVTRDYCIILHIESPTVPSLDLVDLPGVVTAASAGEPSNMPEQTASLVKDFIRSSKDRSLFLCTVAASMAPNTSVALQLLAQEGVLNKTVGVLTMCDDLPDRHHSKLRDRLQQKGDAVVLSPYGWVATMNRPVVLGPMRSNYECLVEQAKAETEFFRFGAPRGDTHLALACVIICISCVSH